MNGLSSPTERMPSNSSCENKEYQAVPKKYEAIRDQLLQQGLPLKEAKRRAAMIFNARRKPGQKPVSGHHKKCRKRK